MRETLKIMSMKSIAYDISFFLTHFVFIFMQTIVFTVSFSISKSLDVASALQIFLILLFFGAALIPMSMIFTIKVHDPQILMIMNFFVLSLPYVLWLIALNLKPQTIYIGYFLPHFSSATLFYELFTPEQDQFNLPASWVSLISAIFFYCFLYRYLDQILANEFGYSKSCCFCLKKRKSAYIQKQIPFIQNDQEAPLKISNLTKKFGRKIAIDNIDFDIKKGEVVCLIGLNDAGKTTLIHLITGIIAPSSGKILIDGKNLQSDKDSARQSLGLCQQFDVLFEHLTVKQHLTLVCQLKNMDQNEIDSHIRDIIDDMNLEAHIHEISYKLEECIKRMLSIAMSIVGKSQLVILDEPTSGLDIISRRRVLDLIKRIKIDRTVIMSTHNLDEAEEISDRVFILKSGSCLAFKTTMEIMNELGNSYNLLIQSNCDADTFTSLKKEISTYIFGHFGIKEKNETRKETIYNIPSSQQSKIPQLLQILEKKSPQIFFDLKMASFEDAFISMSKEQIKEAERLSYDTDQDQKIHNIAQNEDEFDYFNIESN